MKTLLIGLLFVPCVVMAQNDLSSKIKVKDNQGRGLSKRNFSDVDSLLIRSTETRINNHAINTNNPHATTPEQIGAYTQAQVTALLKGYYLPVTVATKAFANAEATGTQPKIIKVLVDESDKNRAGNKYIYDGDNQPLGFPLF